MTFLVKKGENRLQKRLTSSHVGTKQECRLRDHRPAGRPKNLKAEYTPKPNMYQDRITYNIRLQVFSAFQSVYGLAVYTQTQCPTLARPPVIPRTWTPQLYYTLTTDYIVYISLSMWSTKIFISPKRFSEQKSLRQTGLKGISLTFDFHYSPFQQHTQ